MLNIKKNSYGCKDIKVNEPKIVQNCSAIFVTFSALAKRLDLLDAQSIRVGVFRCKYCGSPERYRYRPWTRACLIIISHSFFLLLCKVGWDSVPAVRTDVPSFNIFNTACLRSDRLCRLICKSTRAVIS